MRTFPCLAGIDVHEKMRAVVVRRQAGDEIEYVMKQFGATGQEILHLAHGFSTASARAGE